MNVSRPVRRRRLILLAAAGLSLVIVGSVGLQALRLQSNIETAPIRAEQTEPSPIPLPTQGQDILVIGSDSREAGSGAFGEADGSQRSDALMLVHLAARDARIDAVQIPRDTMMDLPECPDTGRGSSGGGHGQINSALNYGPACSVAAVEKLSGVTIDHFVQLDFDGFAGVVDALGGVSVCLPAPLEDPHAGLNLPAGDQHVGGADALALARTRYAVGDGSDLSRLDHQQQVMSAIVQKAVSAETLTRPDRVLSFLDAVTSSLTVDEGLGALPDLVTLASRVARVPAEKITFVVMPWEVSDEDPNRVQASPDAAVMFSHVQADQPLTFAPSIPDGENQATAGDNVWSGVAVAIENGTGITGLAAEFADKATMAGVNLGDVTTADTAVATTAVRAGSATTLAMAEMLVADLGLNVTPVLDESVTDIVVILGADIDSIRANPSTPIDATHRTADTALCR